MTRITIAIDGHSSCGKSTIARALASELEYVFVDSGAMYRGVTYAFLASGTDIADPQSVATRLADLDVRFMSNEGHQTLLVDGKPLDEELRTMAVNAHVSPVAALSAVRTFLVERQRALGTEGGIVMDGRDIGTVVFPEADLKLFIQAEQKARVNWRYKELVGMGKAVTPEQVRDNLLERDRIDSTRVDSPLRKAPDAVVIETTNLTRAEALAMALALARIREEGKQ